MSDYCGNCRSYCRRGHALALVTVEVIAPTSKLDMLDAMQIIAAATFKWPAR
jgi:hypothetical protein